jgi:hypothetical protein
MQNHFSFRSLQQAALVLSAVAAATAALGLSACGGSGSSQEELALVRQQVAGNVHKEARMRKVESELRQLRNAGADRTTPTAPVAPSSSPYSYATPHPYYIPPESNGSTCGDELSVNSVTTCPFAENVKQAYLETIGSGTGSVEAYSPVTGRNYVMYCTAGSTHECTGGDNAAVYFQ